MKKKYILIHLLVISIFILTCIHFATNVPYWDDIPLIERFIVGFKKAHKIEEYISLFFVENYGHKIAYVRLITLLGYLLTGKVHLKILMAMGFLALAGTLFVFIVFLRKTKCYDDIPKYAIPVSCLIFSPLLIENATWGMSSVQNFSVIFFSVSTIYILLYQVSNLYFFLAISSTTLATLTSGNGFMIWIIGMIILILEKKSIIRKAIWTIYAGLILTFYFGYKHDVILPDKSLSISLSKISLNATALLGSIASLDLATFLDFQRLISFFQKNLLTFDLIIPFFFTFYSFITLGYAIIKNRKNKSREIIFIYSILLFMIATAGGIAISRWYTPSGFLAERYRIISSIFSVCIYLLLITTFKKSLVFKLYCPLICLLYIASFYQSWGNLQRRYSLLKSEIFNHKHNGTWVAFGEIPYYSLRNGLSENVYRFPSDTSTQSSNFNELNNVTVEYLADKNSLVFECAKYQQSFIDKNRNIFIEIKNENVDFLLTPYTPIASVRAFLKSGNYYSKKTLILLNKYTIRDGIIPEGEYEIFLYINDMLKRKLPVSISITNSDIDFKKSIIPNLTISE